MPSLFHWGDRRARGLRHRRTLHIRRLCSGRTGWRGRLVLLVLILALRLRSIRQRRVALGGLRSLWLLVLRCRTLHCLILTCMILTCLIRGRRILGRRLLSGRRRLVRRFLRQQRHLRRHKERTSQHDSGEGLQSTASFLIHLVHLRCCKMDCDGNVGCNVATGMASARPGHGAGASASSIES